MHWFAVAIFISIVISVRSYYKCVCSYSFGTNVYSKPTVQSDILGYLLECKPEVEQSNDQWLTEAFWHQLGYIEKNDQVQVKMCQGTIPDEDRLDPMTTTTTVEPTTTITQEFTTITEVPTTTSEKKNVHLCGNHLINQASSEAGTLARYGHSCYEVFPNAEKTWSEAESFCHSHGGHLAHISSSQEQSFIQGFLQRYSPRHVVWIGLSDKHSEGYFQWTSGNAVHYTNWVPGHISNFVHHSQEDCVVFIPYKNGQWDDIPCGPTDSTNHHVYVVGELHPVLCQYSISTSPSFVG